MFVLNMIINCHSQLHNAINLLHIVWLVKQVVNLIPFNSIGTLSQFKSTSEQKVSQFQKILRGTYNIRTTVRKQMGENISGACGQLVVNLPDKSLGNANPLTDIEDLVIWYYVFILGSI
jgi:adenine C2-methylase RlmN of 23S rRNA A2503 and tRNA A37